MSIHIVVAQTTSVTVWKKVQDWVSVLRQLLAVVILLCNNCVLLLEEL